MGSVIKSREQSVRIVAEHRVMAIVFSLVTIVFQIFFVSWIVRRIWGWWGDSAFIIAAVAFWIIGRRSLRADVATGLLTFVFSIVAFLVLLTTNAGLGISRTQMRLSLDLYPLAGVCIFGFALCPYLDLTFHRARVETGDAEAKSAFQFGFALFFFSMIIFTLWYARFLNLTGPLYFTWLIGLVAIHMLVQAAYTVALHARESMKKLSSGGSIAFLVMIAVAMVAFMTRGRNPEATYFGVAEGERLYRLFMSFYGLVAPAYVLLCMVPTRRRPLIPPSVLVVVAIACAAPFYWIAFIERQMMAVIVGLAIILIARLLLLIPAPNRSKVAAV
jgi:hypothetical protein